MRGAEEKWRVIEEEEEKEEGWREKNRYKDL